MLIFSSFAREKVSDVNYGTSSYKILLTYVGSPARLQIYADNVTLRHVKTQTALFFLYTMTAAIDFTPSR